MRLADILAVERVCTCVQATDKAGVLRELARLFTGLDEEEVLRVLVERERLASTGVGSGVAIPHGRIRGTDRVLAAVAIAPAGIPFDSVDGRPATILVAVLAPDHNAGEHLRALARLSRILRDPAVRDRLLAARDPADALEVLLAEDARQGASLSV
ncbi:MAG: PTS sugar transporter subunit IIA [Myxococcota bacterium]|nr:PTS sugar transporter subunit IIA [Myxococcota bacterium]MDW8361488.1 PTS sugar transporter subunit IIA [Myxococcales bacterium]